MMWWPSVHRYKSLVVFQILFRGSWPSPHPTDCWSLWLCTLSTMQVAQWTLAYKHNQRSTFFKAYLQKIIFREGWLQAVSIPPHQKTQTAIRAKRAAKMSEVSQWTLEQTRAPCKGTANFLPRRTILPLCERCQKSGFLCELSCF